MSGIYIPGMEMPTEGSVLVIDSTGAVWENQWPTRGYFRHDSIAAIHVPPHGRLIDADEFLKRAIGTKCFRGDYALMLEELVGESTTIIPAEEGEG